MFIWGKSGRKITCIFLKHLISNYPKFMWLQRTHQFVSDDVFCTYSLKVVKTSLIKMIFKTKFPFFLYQTDLMIAHHQHHVVPQTLTMTIKSYDSVWKLLQKEDSNDQEGHGIWKKHLTLYLQIGLPFSLFLSSMRDPIWGSCFVPQGAFLLIPTEMWRPRCFYLSSIYLFFKE